MNLLEAIDTLTPGTIIRSDVYNLSLVIGPRKTLRRATTDVVTTRDIIVASQATDWKPVNLA